MAEESHFVIIVDIKQVSYRPPKDIVKMTGRVQTEPERVVDDTLHLVVRKASLADALASVIHHLEQEAPDE